jgi:hypothetical protein
MEIWVTTRLPDAARESLEFLAQNPPREPRSSELHSDQNVLPVEDRAHSLKTRSTDLERADLSQIILNLPFG